MHPLWLTVLVNKLMGAPVAWLLTTLGFRPNPDYPIPEYMCGEILVILLILVMAIALRRGLSVENPGRFQQMMEVFVGFTQSMTDDVIGHGGRRYVPLIGTLGLFVLVCNLIGLIPTMTTPSASIYVTLGCAVIAFAYYNYQGFRQNGVLGYLKHFAGPPELASVSVWLAIGIGVLMVPLEIISNSFRMLSLSVRLWANMLVGNLIEEVFAGLVPVIVPSIFMALHIFVGFLQAYVFMILPAVYISLAASEEH
ncbi:MAG TPA: F0F1 ATP synthase subunit A [Terriglobia bacterium]|nr:F0F1 ATP synthase subunit A [Terriglobia bacterium]